MTGELAEAPFASTTGGTMPAGTLIFPADAPRRSSSTRRQAGRLWIERNVGVAKPATTKVNESPKIAILTTNGTPTRTVGPTTYFTGADTDGVLKILFGADASTWAPPEVEPTADSATDPLANFDVSSMPARLPGGGEHRRPRLG